MEAFKKQSYFEIYSSAICNLNCSYCYIPKVSELKEVNERVVRDLENGAYIEKLKKMAGSDLKGLGFWGAEPTLTLPIITKNLNIFLKEFPNLNHFSFSTNLIKDPSVIFDFLSVMPEDREMSVDIQISIDGHTPITDKNRGIGTTKKISNNIRLLAFMINDVTNKNLKIKFPNKITWTMDNIHFFLKNPEEMEASHEFFTKMQSDLNRINTNPNVKYLINCWGNMEVPGDYSKQDGLDVAELLEVIKRKRIYVPKTQSFLKKRWKFLPLDSYRNMLKKSIVLSRDLYGKQRMFTCSAGDSQFAIAPDGIHPCHRTFTFTVNEIRKYEKCDVEFVYKHMVANEDLEISRLSYVMGAFHNNLRFRQNSAIVSIYEAARTGEILPKYKNYDDAYLLAIMCTNVVSCHMDNFILNSAVGVIPISMLRFFGNGAADIILESVLEDIKNGR